MTIRRRISLDEAPIDEEKQLARLAEITIVDERPLLMTVAPAGWYPDPENAGTPRYWDGAAWAAPLPAKKASRASKLLAGFAIGVGLMGPLSVGGGMLLGGALLGIATLFGMPDPGSAASEALPRWAATGAAVGVPFVLVALLLAILATVRRDRARVGVIVAWIVVGFGLFAVPLFLFTAEPNFL